MRLVVKEHRPVRRWLIGALILAVTGGAALAVLDYGKWRYIFQEMRASAEQKEAWEAYRTLQSENRRLKEQVAHLESSGEVQRQAYAMAQEDLKRLETELLDVREEVEFYRSILASTRSGDGLKIQGLKLQELGTEGRYRYKLVLTHINKDDKVASGSVTVRLENADGSRSLELGELVEPGATGLDFSFKHFARFEGVMSLPEDFRPERVLVAVTETGAKSPGVQKSYEWSRLLQ